MPHTLTLHASGADPDQRAEPFTFTVVFDGNGLVLHIFTANPDAPKRPILAAVSNWCHAFAESMDNETASGLTLVKRPPVR